MEYGKSFSNSLKFGFNYKRWLPLFVLHAVFFFIFISFALSDLEFFVNFLLETEPSADKLILYGQYAIAMFLFMIAWILLTLYVSISILHQAHKEKEVKKSWEVAKKKYLPVLVALIIISIISFIFGLLGAIPVIGSTISTIISFILAMVFIFVMPSIIVKNKRAVEAIKDSYNIFKNNFLKVLIIIIGMYVLSFIITLIFAIPLLILLFDVIMGLAVGELSATSLLLIVNTLQYNLPALITACLIGIVGITISQTFALKLQVEFYKQFRKRKIF